MNQNTEICPCGSNKNYLACCGKFITNQEVAQTPEELMRSRYTAYTKGYIDYIFATMRDAALKNSDREESVKWSKTSKWLGLEVLSSSTTSPTEGEVVFRVTFQQNTKKQILNERARFKKYDNQWYYVGNIPIDEHQEAIKQAVSNKIGRNEACPCASGKKYKKCCG